jgi:hypothetical protein
MGITSQKARDLVALVRKAEGALSVDSVSLDEHVVANVNAMLGSVWSAIGSVEDRLESLNVGVHVDRPQEFRNSCCPL